MELFPDIRKTIDSTHDFSYEAMGRPRSYVLYGPNWANAGSPAFRLYKAFPTEGGTRVAAFVRYPKAISEPRVTNERVFVSDVTPTILELAGVEHPGNQYGDRAIETMTGRSFVPLLNGENDSNPTRVTGVELFGKRAIRVGEWKLVHMPEPYGTNDWQLFNLEMDLSESNDLAAEYPAKVNELKALWEEYASENNVIIPDWVSGY